MVIKNTMLTLNPCYTAGQKIAVKGLMLHSVGCAQPSAQGFVDNWNDPLHDWSCVHAFIDGNTGDVYQCLPWNHRGWHAGDSANNTHIGVEMCEPDCIQYKKNSAEFTCFDVPKARRVAMTTYEAAVELFAYLCKEFNLDPMRDGVVISHSEGHTRGVASNHADPEHLWRQLGLPYTMDTFRKAVKDVLTGNDIKYRVQVGAFCVKSNAENMLAQLAKAGFEGYIVEVEPSTESCTPKEEKPTVDIDSMARDVIAGKYGNGPERKERLGKYYEVVQQRVNELLNSNFWS